MTGKGQGGAARAFAFTVLVSWALQIVIVQTPLLAWVFDTHPLTADQCLVAIGLGAIPLIIIQTTRTITRRRMIAAT